MHMTIGAEACNLASRTSHSVLAMTALKRWVGRSLRWRDLQSTLQYNYSEIVAQVTNQAMDGNIKDTLSDFLFFLYCLLISRESELVLVDAQKNKFSPTSNADPEPGTRNILGDQCRLFCQSRLTLRLRTKINL